jgi:hypothetical protein
MRKFKVYLRALLALPLFVLGLLAFTACTDPATPQKVTPAVEQPADTTKETAPEPEVPLTDAGVFEFGQTASWGDGTVEMTLSAPREHTLGEFDDPEFYSFEQYVEFDVTLTNTGDEVYDPSMSGVLGMSGESSAEEITYDYPQTPLLPGDSVTWVAAFAVADPADLVFEVSPGLEYQAGHEEDFNSYTALFATGQR